MPKMKISKSVKDRLKVTAGGKIIRRKVGHRHKLSAKRSTTTRRGKEPIIVTGRIAKKIRKMLGV